MPKGSGKGKQSQLSTTGAKKEKNLKNPHPENPDGWNLFVKAGIDEFHCGTRISRAAMLDMEAVKFATFHCLICGVKFLSENDHKFHNNRIHRESHLSVCDTCLHPVDSLEEHKITYHPNLACLLPKVEEDSS